MLKTNKRKTNERKVIKIEVTKTTWYLLSNNALECYGWTLYIQWDYFSYSYNSICIHTANACIVAKYNTAKLVISLERDKPVI